jgi:hypothetical protein
VRVSEDLTTLDVTACFASPPAALVAGLADAVDAVVAVEDRTPGAPRRSLSVEGRRIALDGLPANGCAGYVVEVARLGGRFSRLSAEDALLVNGATWLWRPASTGGAPMLTEGEGTLREGTLRFVLPAGVDVAVAWPPVEGRDDTYRIDASTFRFLSHVVLGRFERHELTAPGATILVAALQGQSLAADERIAWIERVTGAVAELDGEFPAERALVVIVPVDRGRDPVAFGNAGRGGGGSVMLLVRDDATRAELERSWVPVHELSHLAVPYVQRDDMWLSEGLATYYQEVLRARAGLQTPLEAWRAIDDGFRRGRQDGTGRTLAEESRRVYESFSFERIYWAGTAIVFLCDVAMRRAGASLDDAIRGVRERYGHPVRAWTGAELGQALDGAVGLAAFARAIPEHLRSTEFPDVEDAYRFLGLVRNDDGLLEIHDAPGAPVRDAIMSPRPR